MILMAYIECTFVCIILGCGAHSYGVATGKLIGCIDEA